MPDLNQPDPRLRPFVLHESVRALLRAFLAQEELLATLAASTSALVDTVTERDPRAATTYATKLEESLARSKVVIEHRASSEYLAKLLAALETIGPPSDGSAS